VMFMDSLQFY